MRTLVRFHLRRRRRNASEDLGVHEVAMIPGIGDEMTLCHRGARITASVVSVLLEGLPDLDGLLLPLVYLAEL